MQITKIENACVHCFDEGKKDRFGNSMLSVKAAVFATAESGTAGTMVCLECIIEASKQVQ